MVDQVSEDTIDDLEYDSEAPGAQDNTEGEKDAVDSTDNLVAEVSTESDRQIADLNDRLLRVTAEFDNYRRRAKNDVDQAYQFSVTKLVKELLPIIDNLKRALSAIDREAEANTYQGVSMTLEMFLKALERQGVTPIAPEVGDAFDPDWHEVVSAVPVPEATPNTIHDVLEVGYALNGRVLRAAMVVVIQAA